MEKRKIRGWTHREQSRLEALYGTIPAREIAKKLGRTEHSVMRKARRLKLRSGLGRFWKETPKRRLIAYKGKVAEVNEFDDATLKVYVDDLFQEMIVSTEAGDAIYGHVSENMYQSIKKEYGIERE